MLWVAAAPCLTLVKCYFNESTSRISMSHSPIHPSIQVGRDLTTHTHFMSLLFSDHTIERALSIVDLPGI